MEALMLVGMPQEETEQKDIASQNFACKTGFASMAFSIAKITAVVSSTFRPFAPETKMLSVITVSTMTAAVKGAVPRPVPESVTEVELVLLMPVLPLMVFNFPRITSNLSVGFTEMLESASPLYATHPASMMSIHCSPFRQGVTL